MQQSEGKGDGASGSDHFLHQRVLEVEDIYKHSDKGPGIGKGELAVVQFMISWRKHGLSKPTRWLVTSTNTGQLMVILLVMAMGMLYTVSITVIKVTVKRDVQEHTDCLYVNRVSGAIRPLRDEINSAWPLMEVWSVAGRTTEGVPLRPRVRLVGE